MSYYYNEAIERNTSGAKGLVLLLHQIDPISGTPSRVAHKNPLPRPTALWHFEIQLIFHLLYLVALLKKSATLARKQS